MARSEMDKGSLVVLVSLKDQKIFRSDVSVMLCSCLGGDLRFTCWNGSGARS
jgi:hypothetical protein